MANEGDILEARPVEFPEMEWLEAGMRLIGYFSELAQHQLAEVLPLMLMLRYVKGAVICSEGDPGDALYLIYRGGVTATKKAWKEPVARLKEGDFFGEMSLLFGEPRTATITTDMETEVFCLASVDFQRVIKKAPDMAAALTALAEKRRQELARH